MTTAQANLEQFSPIEMPQGQLMAAGEETVVQESIQQERNHLLGAHVTEFARNSMRRIATGAAVCAAAFGASEMANPATAEAKAKTTTPEQMLWDIRKVQYKYDGSSRGGSAAKQVIRKSQSLDAVKATLTADTLSIRGKCSTGKGWRPYYKSIEETSKLQTRIPCDSRVDPHVRESGGGIYTADSYSRDLKKLGNKAAASVGIDKASHGLATKITATKSSARISFEPVAIVSENTAGRQLQTLIIRKGKKPVEEWYDASELAKAAPEASQISE